MKTNDNYLIEIVTLNHITVCELLVLDWNTWNHIIVYKVLVYSKPGRQSIYIIVSKLLVLYRNKTC